MLKKYVVLIGKAVEYTRAKATNSILRARLMAGAAARMGYAVQLVDTSITIQHDVLGDYYKELNADGTPCTDIDTWRPASAVKTLLGISLY